MKNGIYLRPAVVRIGVALLLMAGAAVIIKETPEIRRYIKAETM